jgi:hypothetical protein
MKTDDDVSCLQTVVSGLVSELYSLPRLTPAPYVFSVIHRVPEPCEFALSRWWNRTNQSVDDRRISFAVPHDIAVMQIANQPPV